MAAATLKSIAQWMEGQLDGAGPCQALVQQVLSQVVQEAKPGGAHCAAAQGPTIHETQAWDSIMPTQQSFGLLETSGWHRRLIHQHQAAVLSVTSNVCFTDGLASKGSVSAPSVLITLVFCTCIHAHVALCTCVHNRHAEFTSIFVYHAACGDYRLARILHPQQHMGRKTWC